MFSSTLLLAALIGCGGDEPAKDGTVTPPPELPATTQAAPPPTLAMADLQAQAENIALVPSPAEMQRALEKAKVSHAELFEEQKAVAARIGQADEDVAKATADVVRMEGERARFYQTRVDEAAAANVDLTIQPDKL